MQSLSDTLAQVLNAMMANKLRTFLTMFGIAWGVGSLLVLVGLGEGFRSGQHRQLASFGNDLVMMWNGTIPALANQHTGMRPYQLTTGDEDAIRKLLRIAEASKTAAPEREPNFNNEKSRRKTSRQRTGTVPQYEYWKPLLISIYELGGSVNADAALKHVEEKMRSILGTLDYQELSSGGPRWHKNANWARYYLVRKGLLKAKSRRGMWELSDEGMQSAKDLLSKLTRD